MSKLCIFLNSINAVGVEIGHVSGMRYEQVVLLLPGLPLVNRPGENPEADLWTFEVETPRPSVATGESPSVTIDYVHPGTCACRFNVLCSMFIQILTRYFPMCDRLHCLIHFAHAFRMGFAFSGWKLATFLGHGEQRDC